MNALRRATLKVLVLATVALSGHRIHRHLQNTPPHPEYRTLARRLARLAHGHRAMRGLGLDYLQSLDTRPTADLITQRWFPTERERRWAMTLEPPQLAGHVAIRAREDFREARIVSVRGWMLSETEAEFASLAALVRRA